MKIRQLGIFDDVTSRQKIPCLLCAIAFHSGNVQYFSPNKSDAMFEAFTSEKSFKKYMREVKSQKNK